MIAGITLLLLGALGLVSLVDLAREATAATTVDLGVADLSIRLSDLDEIVVAASVLGMLTGAALVGGIALLRADRGRRRRERERADQESETGRRETLRRLLADRVELLSATVKELEERQVGLRQDGGGSPGAVGAEARGPSTTTERLVVLPEAPPDHR